MKRNIQCWIYVVQLIAMVLLQVFGAQQAMSKPEAAMSMIVYRSYGLQTWTSYWHKGVAWSTLRYPLNTLNVAFEIDVTIWRFSWQVAGETMFYSWTTEGWDDDYWLNILLYRGAFQNEHDGHRLSAALLYKYRNHSFGVSVQSWSLENYMRKGVYYLIDGWPVKKRYSNLRSEHLADVYVWGFRHQIRTKRFDFEYSIYPRAEVDTQSYWNLRRWYFSQSFRKGYYVEGEVLLKLLKSRTAGISVGLFGCYLDMREGITKTEREVQPDVKVSYRIFTGGLKVVLTGYSKK